MIARHRQRLRRASQITFLLVFLGLQVFTRSESRALGWADLFFRFDPLVAFAATLAGRVVVAGLLASLFSLALTAVLGRVWCGWVCPVGSVLEWLGPDKGQRRPHDLPERWRGVKVLLLVGILMAALLANQTLLILDPITIGTRTVTGGVLPPLRYGVYQIEAALYQFDLLWPVLDWAHQHLVLSVLQDVEATGRLALPLLAFFGMLVAANWWAERSWCRYLCPLGALLGLVSRFALVRREVDEGCKSCGRCQSDCPTGTIDPGRGFRSDPAECIVCLRCVDTCTRGDVAFRWQQPGWHPARSQAYDPSRRHVLAAIGIAAAGVALAGTGPTVQRPVARLIRPPGATQGDFESRCIRCFECVRVCPTKGLQPTLLEDGWHNSLTPALIPRLGYCSFSCNACGQVCPTGALPELGLAEKRRTAIGLARVDRDRCLPWAYDTPCIICEEACPVADKAIELETYESIDEQGAVTLLQRPRVVRSRCIGCGICEFQCPLGGDAAIQVYAPTELDESLGIADLD